MLTASQGTALALIETLRSDASPQVRAEAALTLASLPLGRHREDTVAALIDTLHDAHDLPRRAAALGLGEHVDESVASHLVKLLSDAPELWREVGNALAGRGASLVESEIIDILTSGEDVRSRRGAARALRSDDGARRMGLPLPPSLSQGEMDLFGYEDPSGARHVLC